MKNRKLYYFALVPCLIGIILGSIFDYKINETIYSENNGFGIFCSAFLPIIGYSILAIFAGFVHRAAIKEKNIYIKIAFFLASLAGMIATTIISAGHVTSVNAYNCPEWKWLWIIIEALIYSAIFLIGDHYGKTNDNKLIVYATFVLTAFILLDLIPIAQIIKSVVRRPRYRICIENNFGSPIVSFANWWEPQNDLYKALSVNYPNISEHFKSFPSGHASVSAALILGLPFLSNFIPKLKGKENLLFAIGMVFTVIMGFSRMLVGAHYLSDVCFGALFMVVCCMIANEINLKFFIKEDNAVQLK